MASVLGIGDAGLAADAGLGEAGSGLADLGSGALDSGANGFADAGNGILDDLTNALDRVPSDTSVSTPNAAAKYACAAISVIGGAAGVYALSQGEKTNPTSGFTAAEATAGIPSVLLLVCFGVLWGTGVWGK